MEEQDEMAIRLIELVRLNPILQSRYMNKVKVDEKNRAWEEIAETLGITVSSAKIKWSRLKNKYKKFKNYDATVRMSRYLEEWKSTYEPLLTFLDLENSSPERDDSTSVARQSQFDMNFGTQEDGSLGIDTVESKEGFTLDETLENESVGSIEDSTLDGTLENDTAETKEDFTLYETLDSTSLRAVRSEFLMKRPKSTKVLPSVTSQETSSVPILRGAASATKPVAPSRFTLGRLIELVRLNPILQCYNSYKIDEKNRAWEEIAETLGITVYSAKMKWSRLKRKYKKFKNYNATVRMSYLKEWKSTYEPLLTFLDLENLYPERDDSTSVARQSQFDMNFGTQEDGSLGIDTVESKEGFTLDETLENESVGSIEDSTLDGTLENDTAETKEDFTLYETLENDTVESKEDLTLKETATVKHILPNYDEPVSSISNKLLDNIVTVKLEDADTVTVVKLENTDADEITASPKKTMSTYSDNIKVKKEISEPTHNTLLPSLYPNSKNNLFPKPTTTIFSGVTQVSSTSPIFASSAPLMTSKPFVSLHADNFVRAPGHPLSNFALRNSQTSTATSYNILSQSSSVSNNSIILAPFSTYTSPASTTIPGSALLNPPRAPAATTFSNSIAFTSPVNTTTVPPLIFFNSPSNPKVKICMPVVSLEHLSDEEILKRTRKKPPVRSSTLTSKAEPRSPALKKKILEPALPSSTSLRAVRSEFLMKRPKSTKVLPSVTSQETSSVPILRGAASATKPIAPSRVTLAPKRTLKVPISTHQMTNSNPADPVPSKKKKTNDQEDCLDKVLNFLHCKAKKDPVDMLFKSYAKTLQQLRPINQVKVKVKLAALFAKAELGILDEL